MMVCGVTLTVLGQAARAQDAGFDAEQHASAFCYTCGDTLSTGYYHTCGIEKNGTMHCWGSNAENQTRIPKQYVRFKARHNGTRVAWSILYEWHKSVPDPKTGELLLFNFSDAEAFQMNSSYDMGQAAKKLTDIDLNTIGADFYISVEKNCGGAPRRLGGGGPSGGWGNN